MDGYHISCNNNAVLLAKEKRRPGHNYPGRLPIAHSGRLVVKVELTMGVEPTMSKGYCPSTGSFAVVSERCIYDPLIHVPMPPLLAHGALEQVIHNQFFAGCKTMPIDTIDNSVVRHPVSDASAGRTFAVAILEAISNIAHLPGGNAHQVVPPYLSEYVALAFCEPLEVGILCKDIIEQHASVGSPSEDICKAVQDACHGSSDSVTLVFMPFVCHVITFLSPRG